LDTVAYERRPIAGIGVGLRFPHLGHILRDKPEMGWFEVLTDNFFGPQGEALKQLEQVRGHYPIAMHSVGMSLGAVEPIDWDYVRAVDSLAGDFEPEWISEHLCWTTAHGVHFHDLLPLPYTEESVTHVAGRIRQVQDFMGRQLVIENVSSYISFKHSTLSEGEFVAAVATSADCRILLDINNIYTSQMNHGEAAQDYLKSIPPERVQEMHLAGGEERDGYLLDSHSRPVPPAVWQLYEAALRHCGSVPTLIEWDNDIPEFAVLQQQAALASKCIEAVQG
jgi:uncharacterized protein